MTYKTDMETRMKGILIAAILFCLIVILAAISGCGSVSVTKNADGSYEANSRSLFKDIKDVSIHKDADGEVQATMGSSVVNQNAESALMLVCVINPALPLCSQ